MRSRYGDYDDGTARRRRPPQEGNRHTGYNQHYGTKHRSRPEGPILFKRPGLITRRQELALLLVLAASMAAWFLTPLSDAAAGLVLRTIPFDSDVELGREALRSLQAKYPPVPDRWGVERIGWDLADTLRGGGGGAGSPGYRWSFGVVRADFVNAFALPGGIVQVTDSLLRRLRLTDAEIAALIGHEMGHVLHRHSQRREVKRTLLGTVLRAFVYEDGDGYDESFGEAVGEILLKGAAWLGEQGFSRRDEYEADGTAWEILVDGGTYDPRAVQGLLSKLWSLEGGTGETRWESTHPGTADRIKALQDKWDRLDWRERRRLSKYPVK